VPGPADRARKARRSSVLACGCYIQTGHMIARVDGRWICIEHALEGREEVTAVPDDDDAPEPVYDAMIKRDDDGPDPLVPEPLGTPGTSKKGK
jgi:hypothetical protein